MDNHLSKETLAIDAASEISRIGSRLKEILRNDLHRRGYVVAISGGVDSAVCAALCVEAVGSKKVLGLLLPEKDSSPESLSRGILVAGNLGLEYLVQDIEPTLEAIGCYRWRDEAIKAAIPEFESGWKNKIVISGGTEGRINHFVLVAQSPDGTLHKQRLGLNEYLQIVAATSYKQRIRKTIEYFHADRLNYAVVGTPNRLEYDQGFFVKNGDGSADVKPIAHLYKSQVYMLARQLGLPEEICNAAPTTDTYSLPQGQDEFYFALSYPQMDLALWAHNHSIPASRLGEALGVGEDRARLLYSDIETKRRTTRHLHNKPIPVEPVPEIH